MAQNEKKAAEYYDEASKLFRESCVSDDYDITLCNAAINKLEAVIKLDPKKTEAYLILAKAYWNKSFLDSKSTQDQDALQEKAAALVRKALDIDPNNAEAAYELTFYIKNPDEQIMLLRKTIEINSKHPEAHGDLARILMKQGNVDDAIKEFRIHLQVSPHPGAQDVNNYILFARSLSQSGRLKESVQIYEKILDLTKEESRFERCQYFKSLNVEHYSAFKDFAAKVKKLRPYCTKLGHRDRAVQMERQGKIDEVIQELQLQIKENPYYEDSYFLLEDIYKNQGQMNKALDALKMYFEVEKDPVERCKNYRRLNLNIYTQIDKQFVEKLKSDCKSIIK
jgi:tetratricopeptide (TPR) repeat protein